MSPKGNSGLDTVIKVGGGLLADPGVLDATLASIAGASRERRLLIVPGGGPFADAVRTAYQKLSLPESIAHWMAVLAMDQYAHLIASRIAGGLLVTRPNQIVQALDRDHVPVLAPYEWLREADPLPHTWDVTSDSIAAWVAGALGASTLVLIKPPGAVGDNLVDRYFHRALPAGVTPTIVAADRFAHFEEAEHAETSSRRDR